LNSGNGNAGISTTAPERRPIQSRDSFWTALIVLVALAAIVVGNIFTALRRLVRAVRRLGSADR